MEYLKKYTSEELIEMLKSTKVDYLRADINCWYDKIIRRETKFIAIRDILDERKIELKSTERKLHS